MPEVMQNLSARPDRGARLARLRRRIERIERGDVGSKSPKGGGRFVTGGERFTIDRARMQPLQEGPGKLDPFRAGDGDIASLHELVADDYGSRPSARDFALALVASLLKRTADNQGMVLWCQRQRDVLEFGRLYGPGLLTLGLPPDRLLMVTGRRDADCLWAMEQGLASRSLLAVVGQVERAGLIASRRLSLAARAHDTCCLLLPLRHGQEPSAARTRWRIKAAASLPDRLDPEGLGLPAWHLDLERSPNGRTGHWTVEWDHAAHHFHLAPDLGNRPAARRTRSNQENGDVVAFERTG